jgi:hypothetical protein
MTQDAQDLATRFAEANRAVIAVIERCPEARLHTFCPVERCTVAALACHIAEVHAVGADWVRTVLDGEPLPAITLDMVDQINGAHFALNANRSRDEALARLRRHGAEAAAVLRGLDDADLDRTAPFTLFGCPTTSVRELIERILIADPESHLASIRAAIWPEKPA